MGTRSGLATAVFIDEEFITGGKLGNTIRTIIHGSPDKLNLNKVPSISRKSVSLFPSSSTSESENLSPIPDFLKEEKTKVDISGTPKIERQTKLQEIRAKIRQIALSFPEPSKGEPIMGRNPYWPERKKEYDRKDSFSK